MKHTQGKWTFREKVQDNKAVIDIDGELFALIEFPLVKDQKNIEANARLVAAAPDLLEACKELIGAYASFDAFDKSKGQAIFESKTNAVRKATQAIAKAEQS